MAKVTPITHTENASIKLAFQQLDILHWPHELVGIDPHQTSVDIDFKKALKELPRTETVAAQNIASKFRHRLSYHAASDTWYMWTGRIHQPTSSNTVVFKIIKKYFEATSDAINLIEERIENLVASAADPDAKRKELYGLLQPYKYFEDSLSKVSTHRNIMAILQSEIDVDQFHYTDDRRWNVFVNGVYDTDEVRLTRKFDLKPHDPSRPVFREWDIVVDENAKAPHLMKFLNESLEDASQVQFLQKVTGTAVFGVNKSTKSVVLLKGATNSGKSMFIRIMRDLAGEGSGYVEAPKKDAIIKRAKENVSHALHVMKDARIVEFGELTDPLDSVNFLKYAGADLMRSDDKWVKQVAWYPQGVMFFVTNHTLNIDMTDPAIYDRVKPINFPHTFVHASKAITDPDDPGFGDQHIMDELLQDKIMEERSGVLEWLKAGFLMGLDEGFPCTESMTRLKDDDNDEGDEITAYLRDRAAQGILVPNENLTRKQHPRVSEVYADYKIWHKAHWNGRPLDQIEVSRRIGEKYAKIKADGTRFLGLQLTNAIVPVERG